MKQLFINTRSLFETRHLYSSDMSGQFMVLLNSEKSSHANCKKHKNLLDVISRP